MANIRDWIESWLDAHNLDWRDVEAVYLGDKGTEYTDKSAPDVVSVPDAIRILDYEFDAEDAVEHGHDFYVYLKDWVLFKVSCDGLEFLEAVPRNPTMRTRRVSVGS